MGVDMVVRNADKDRLVERALTELSMETMPEMSAEPGESSLFTRGRQRAFVKVQDGCRYRCTFCIVTIARGEEASRPIDAVIEDINTLHTQGINEIILTGVHLGGYGSELGYTLCDLIKAILERTEISRLRLGSLEPWEFSDEFFELFSNPRLMPHLHLPLQSGADSVLRRMARRCKTEEFAAIVKQLRQHVPHFNITTDIIVGFPGETGEEWQQSVDFIKQIGFGHIHIFTYSSRKGTKAATLPDHIDSNTKKQRSQQLHTLANAMKLEFYQDNIGQTFPVLWEGYSEACSDNKKRVFGYTPNYLRAAVIIHDDESLENQLVNTKLTRINDDYIVGEMTTSAECRFRDRQASEFQDVAV
ncbi:MiaB-like tRNA modifying enzyme (fragment) [Crenothrix polyspora]|uniref:MiaB-like tRNA modifying enzyme n=2 Tax=Crenothrix polyspora TaxID=360316 RepID=A0A1R4HAY2_9GAMM